MNRPSPCNRWTIRIALTLCGLLSLLNSGCSQPRVIVVPVTTPRQLAETLEGYVFVPDEKGTLVRSADRVPLYAGEWVLTMPEEKRLPTKDTK